MTISVRKWGNSAAVRIPAEILDTAKIKLDQPVSVRAEGHRIVIEAVETGYDLDALIAGITASNRHDETEWGEPVGQERV